MAHQGFSVVTGAFGFTGRSIARKLLESGERVRTLTGHPERENEFGDRVAVAPFDFEHPERLAESLAGARVFYNTYWIRFPYGSLTFEKAVQNTFTLVKAAKEAGVRRLVHISITNPTPYSSLPYFSGKARIEKAIEESGLSYAILRPAVIFGDQGILINNMAWFLRRLPIFLIPGDGRYGIQPIFVEDLADLAVSLAAGDENTTVDAVGPETYSFNDMMALIARTVGSRTKFIHVPPTLAYLAAAAMGRIVGDVVLTRDEVVGLMANLLVSDKPPTGRTKLSDWLAENASWLGRRYMSEVRRHYG